MKRAWTVAPVLALLLGACSIGDFTFRDDPATDVATEKLVVFSAAEADKIQVQADRISLPYDGYEALLTRRAGDVLASDRGSPHGTNPVGFLRTFKSATHEADRIVILTGPAALTDVVRGTNSKVQLRIPDAPVTPKSLGEPIGQSRQALSIDKTVTFAEGSKDVTINLKGKSITLTLGAELNATTHLQFDPSFDIGLQIGSFKVQEFHAIANGAVDASLTLEGKGSVSWEKSLTDGEPASEVEKAIQEAVESASGYSQAKPVWSTSIGLPTWFVGPVPVVTDLNFALDLDCKVSVEGSVTATYTAAANAAFSGGVRYQNETWSPVSSTSFSQSHQGPSFLVGGGAGLECALKPSLQLRFYGLIGPYVFFQVKGGIDANLDTECGPDPGMPNCSVSVTGSASVQGGVGAKIDINVLGLTFREDLGEMTLFDQTLLDAVPILGPVDFGQCPLGYCFGSTPACGDGSCNGTETCTTCEQDCGVCPASCGDASCNGTENCTSCPSDCGNCPAGCPDNTCNNGETCSSCPQDCGACPPACGDGSCNGAESCSSCSQDCGNCPPACGDGSCNGTESCTSCSQDCGTCPPTCPDGSCNNGETCSSCPQDCGGCQPVCGDSACNGTEDCSSCPGDCGSCPACSYGSQGENLDSCAGVALETWRCVNIPSWGTNGSQVCRNDASCPSNPCWLTYHINPTDCAACCGSYAAGCE